MSSAIPVKRFNPLLLNFSRLLAGFVFIYSGFVKGIDPLGSAYKFIDYFVAFNIEFLEPLALPMSVALSAAEMLIGVALIAGVHLVLTSWALLLFMGFFTILTLFIAITDPVADCGCFGDAIILTNWETFWKNLVLMVFVIYIFIRRKEFRPFFNRPLAEWITVSAFLAGILAIFAWSYLNLPVIDYRPYHVGADIEEYMSIPPDAPADEYEVTLYYRKDGETRAFPVDDLPGPEWEWVRTESTLISKGYEPPITNFFIESVTDGTDHTWDILHDQGYTFILVSYNLAGSSLKNVTAIKRLADWSAGHGINFIGLTASPLSQIDEYRDNTGAAWDFYHGDEITLKTIVRSNPGLILLKEGTIIGKWHHRNIPDTAELKENLMSFAMNDRQQAHNNMVSLGYLMAFLLLIAIIRMIRYSLKKRDIEPESQG
ncbi:MAG: DoxX family protein [Marinilabiliales bacterium]|nr:MAG: DoxX family protein [Marinilabiliales bacterium]